MAYFAEERIEMIKMMKVLKLLQELNQQAVEVVVLGYI